MDLIKKEEILPISKEEYKDLESIESITVITFYINKFLFGIPAEKIVEITKNLEITPVPLSENYILGITNLRGRIITAIDLAKKINIPTQKSPNLNIIVEYEDELVAFVVEKVGDVLQIPVSKLETPPEKIEGINKEYIEKVYQLEDKILLLLDIEKLFKN
ncbi:MAG: chemotaxis protein CheW [Thermodesulfobacteriota bacterium]|nr:MAG: chemotaxis protein CheW [Thermodesulfobacteriota bacterium]